MSRRRPAVPEQTSMLDALLPRCVLPQNGAATASQAPQVHGVAGDVDAYVAQLATVPLILGEPVYRFAALDGCSMAGLDGASGLYVLFGEDFNDNVDNGGLGSVVYAGQSTRCDGRILSIGGHLFSKQFVWARALRIPERVGVAYKEDLDAAEHAMIVLLRPMQNSKMPRCQPEPGTGGAKYVRNQHHRMPSLLFRSWLARLRALFYFNRLVPAKKDVLLMERLRRIVTSSFGAWLEPGIWLDTRGRWHVWWFPNGRPTAELRVCDKASRGTLLSEGRVVSQRAGAFLTDTWLSRAWRWASERDLPWTEAD